MTDHSPRLPDYRGAVAVAIQELERLLPEPVSTAAPAIARRANRDRRAVLAEVLATLRELHAALYPQPQDRP